MTDLLTFIEATKGTSLKIVTSDVGHLKFSLEVIRKDQLKQNKASEDIMAALKENAGNAKSNYKLIFAVFFFVVIIIVFLLFTLRFGLR